MNDIRKTVDDALSWASRVSDMWVGTQYEQRIDSQQAQIIKALETNDEDKTMSLVVDFVQFLSEAESEYSRV